MLAEARTLDKVKHIIDVAEAARTYARAAKLGLESLNNAAEIKLRAERKAGELLKQLERGSGGDRKSEKIKNSSVENLISEYREVLTEQEIPNTTAFRWQTVASIPEKQFEKHIAEVIQTGGELTTAGLLKAAKAPHVSQNGGVNEWYTPPEYIACARAVMGRIDLDPASSEIANKIVGATRYYTVEDDGLCKFWAGKVWMNPPYSIELITQFIAKYVQHVEAKEISEGIVLVQYGKITPTDIDGLIEYQNKAYILLEAKSGDAPTPYGQKLALERMCDDLQKIKPTLLIFVHHDTPVNQAIDFARCQVGQFRYKGQYRQFEKSVKQLIDWFLRGL